MFKKFHGRRVLAIIGACIFSLLGATAVLAAESAVAAAMQLMKTEGTVSASDGQGKAVSIFEKMRLHSGYQLKTEEASYAWINLDSSKLIKMDAASEVAIQKSGKQLEVRLAAGGLFFNVTEPLEEDETLNIRVSTMVVGVRGTCGWVRIVDPWTTQVGVLEGTVRCSVTDPVTGQTKTEDVRGGEEVTCVVYEQDKPGDKCDILRGSFTREEIQGFILADVLPDKPLCEKIYESSGLDLRTWELNPLQKLRQEQAAVHEKLGEIVGRLTEQMSQISENPVWTNPGGGLDPSVSSGSSSSREEVDPWEDSSSEDSASSESRPSPGGPSESSSSGSSSESSSSGSSSESSSSESSSSDSSSESSSSDSSSEDSSSSQPSTSATLTMPVTVPEIAAALQEHDEVTIQNP